MISSMTGYASVVSDLGHAVLGLELKGVNSRFLDIAFRLGDDLRPFEMPLRERIGERVGRGKLELRGYLQAQSAATRARTPNAAVLDELAGIEALVRARLPDARPLSVADVLRWPGVLDDARLEPGQLQDAVLSAVTQLLDEFVDSRRREGARLETVLREKVLAMRTRLDEVTPGIPAAIDAYEARLAAKLRDAVAALDEDRLRQEVGLFAAKVDVAEELARLQMHLAEAIRVLDAGGAVGKRLDFLMQELNREANTLASKSVSADVTAAALDLKLLIEQMREQVQNLE